MSPPSSAWKNKQSNPPAFVLVPCSANPSTQKIETYFSETTIDFQRSIVRYIPENISFHYLTLVRATILHSFIIFGVYRRLKQSPHMGRAIQRMNSCAFQNFHWPSHIRVMVIRVGLDCDIFSGWETGLLTCNVCRFCSSDGMWRSYSHVRFTWKPDTLGAQIPFKWLSFCWKSPLGDLQG
jgi:hypothetical protein